MVYDIAIAGGGINGAGIAADAAGRGLSVLLVEKVDLASATSSASSKLIHGGLRYLEHYEFRLVREALQEREVLLANAGHIVWPQRFVLPRVQGGRSGLMLRAGLFLYDNLGARQRIPGSASLDLRHDAAGHPLRMEIERGFAYWDCRMDDARLVVFNAIAARQRGAVIATRTALQSARAENGIWRLALESSGAVQEASARVLVNAAGPWVDGVDGTVQAAGETSHPKMNALRLVKGSHIVVPRIPGADDAYLFQNSDGRVVFAIPYEERFTLIGTTDVDYSGDPRTVAISDAEIDYLLELVRRYFSRPPERSDIVWSFAGVRPLYGEHAGGSASAVTRDYHLEVSQSRGAPLLTVLGGKLTTYRRLAEAAMDMLSPHFPGLGPKWTASTPLPGGALGADGLAGFVQDLCRRYPGFDAPFLGRLARRYGSLTDTVLAGAKDKADLGADFGAGLTEREVVYLRDHEWAQTPEDVLWRRTKCGLHMNDAERAAAVNAIARIL
ncbi:Aerobic glycerol-3-phosphate dehydrogenase [Hyphomicrobium sulfonivorans]|uniref:Aerobic glycerol-3-phosphate dehydrogenase n=1 Tax=Hyphomicrobium sulfonivorans TaxID=121290 RepID=A0A120CV14_HYPSL|nr:glycerol-3-phosphate dehydrogenase [Hyphomicrobium sulfonivorans]KWT67107.1 Aerobic glycerol-3-phosphate dehydrogenase [Hyphomicrobium sulfonivorans]